MSLAHRFPRRFALGCALLLVVGSHASAQSTDVSDASHVSIDTQATSAAIEANAESDAAADEYPWALRHRAYSTWQGSSGGLFVDDPGVGAQGSVRMQLAIDSYAGSDFLYDGDEVEQNRQALSVSWTALQWLEAYAALHNRVSVADLPEQDTLSSFGDLAVGAKVGAEVSPIFRLSGGLRLLLQGGVGAAGSLLDAVSLGLRGSAAIDLQGLEEPVPLIMRLNVDYLFDNSAKVFGDAERARYANLEDPAPKRADEVRALLTRVERFGMGVNRVDMFTLGLGAELPLELAQDFYLHPLLDFRVGVPVNRQDYDCAFFSADPDRGTREPGADDTCLDDADAGAWPMNFAFGVRVVPPVRGVSLLVGADIGLSGTDTFVRELAPTAPFRVLFALSYDYDAAPAPLPVVAPPPPPPPAAPEKSDLLGRVIDQASGAPIGGAVVRFEDRELTALATDDKGTFGIELDPGAVQLQVSHPAYAPGTCAATIPEDGSSITLECTLTALPTTGSVKGTLRDSFGAAVAGAQIQITGITTIAVTSDAAGDFMALDLAPGDYTARIESSAHLMRVVRFTVQPRQQTSIELAVTPKPEPSGVSVGGGQLIARNLRFDGDAVELSQPAALAVAEVADHLMRDATIRRLRVQCNGADGLSLNRALLIKQRIVDAGVPDARLEVVAEPASRCRLSIVE